MPVDKFNLKTQKIEQTGRTEPIVEIDTSPDAIEKFIAKAKRFRNYPPAQFTYHAFGNQRGNWTLDGVTTILRYAREHDLEVRSWENRESAIILIVVKDPDSTENSGFEIYTKMKDMYQSYGLAFWYEFDKWGVELLTKKGTIVKKTTDGFGICVGKGNNWVILS